MKKIILSAIIMILVAGSALFAAPELTQWPKVLVPADQPLALQWTGTANPCKIVFGVTPLTYTAEISQTGTGQTVFTPLSSGMTGGVYYCRVYDTVLNQYSKEFRLFIETTIAPQYSLPANSAALDSLNPNFSWQAVSGVPYYTIVVFDTKAQIDLGTNSLTITANAIWAATTNQTSLNYPQPDPSGYYNKLAPPPLMQGLTYSWAVINNYSGSPSMVSTAFAGTRVFSVNPPSACSAPVLSAPADGVTLTASPVTLSWQPASGANLYEVYLLRSANGNNLDFSGGDKLLGAASVPVWSALTTNTQIDIPANIGLFNSDYSWYVIALDNEGRGTKSALREFNYNTITTAINIRVQEEIDGLPSNLTPVPEAIIFVETVSGGSVNLYPYTCADDGTLNGGLPYGDYKFTVQKDGFNTAVFYETVSNIAINDVFTVTESAYSVTGSVNDDQSNPVSGANITASANGVTAQAVTLSNGSFVLFLNDAGPWNVNVQKPGYAPANIGESVMFGNFDSTIAAITIKRNVNILSGSVTNQSSQGIAGTLITVFDSSNTANVYSTVTSFSGSYTLNVPDGAWTVSASQAGFIPPPVTTITLSGGQTGTRNFTLLPQANIISGRVTQSGTAFSGVLVKAVPSSGPPIQTTTDVFGNYTISTGNGNYTLDAVIAGYTSSGARVISFATGGNTSAGNDFVMTANTSFVKGKITTDTAGLNPLAGVLVTNGLSSVYTDVLGNYSISMLSGTYTITANMSGYSPDGTRLVTPGPGQTLNNTNFVLSPNASVMNGTVGDTSGIPVSSANVFAVGAGVTVTALSDGSGNFSISASYGVYSLHASKSGFIDSAHTVVNVSPGQVSNGIQLALTQDIGYVKGLITDGTNPVSSAGITIYDSSGSTLTALTDINGNYLAGIKTGGYGFKAGKTGYVDSLTMTDTVSAANTTINARVINAVIQPAAKIIQGTITDGTGNSLNNVAVTVTAPGATINATTDGAGFYSASIPGISTSVNVVAVRTGYVTFNQDVTVAQQIVTKNIQLSVNYGSLMFSVSTSDSSAVNAVISANGNTRAVAGASPVNNAAIPLLAGSYNVTISQPGYVDITVLNVPIISGITNNIGAKQLNKIVSRTVSGNVTDGSSGISGATVEIRDTTGQNIIAQTVTDASGNYSISGLQAGSYLIDAIKTGYLTAGQLVDVTSLNASGINMVLNKNNSAIFVYVSDGTTHLPVSGVFINLAGTGANLGYTGSGTTGPAGGVTITAMNFGTYDITLTKAGYTVVNSSVSLINGTTVNYSYAMNLNPALLGLLVGTVKDGNNGAVQGTNINVYAQSAPEVIYVSAQSDSNGLFGIPLPAGNYTAVAVKNGYVSSPAADYALITTGNTTTAQFTLKQVTGGGISITAPVNPVFNTGIGGPYNFSAAYADAGGQNVPVSFNWSVEPIQAGSISGSGIFTPSVNYLGEVSVIASALNASTTVTVPVFQKLIPSTGVLSLTDFYGMNLDIPANAADLSNTIDRITMFKYTAGTGRAATRDNKVVGPIYSFTDGFKFSKSINLTLPVQSGYSSKGLSIGLWDKDNLTWDPIGGVFSNGSISSNVNHFSEYVVLSQMQPLSADFVTLTPNPFSPLRSSLKISYVLNSKSGSSVETTIKVFNMADKLIRTIEDRQLKNTGTVNTDTWDGKDEHGKWAANGRYIVQFEIKDTSNTKQYLYSVALVK